MQIGSSLLSPREDIPKKTTDNLDHSRYRGASYHVYTCRVLAALHLRNCTVPPSSKPFHRACAQLVRVVIDICAESSPVVQSTESSPAIVDGRLLGIPTAKAPIARGSYHECRGVAYAY